MLALTCALVAVAGCGGSSRDDPMSIQDALDAKGDAVVEGAIIAPRGQPVRLCSAILESYPPMCGGPSLVVRGLDLDSVKGIDRAAGVSWTGGPVRLRGTLANGVLVVRTP
jgi:hypothetical protein